MLILSVCKAYVKAFLIDGEIIIERNKNKPKTAKMISYLSVGNRFSDSQRVIPKAILSNQKAKILQNLEIFS